MDFMASLLVGKPLHILLVAAGLLSAYLGVRFHGRGRRTKLRPVLVNAIAWSAYAAWEWLVQIQTPEASIRVDLLLIWPTLAGLSAWAILRMCR